MTRAKTRKDKRGLRKVVTRTKGQPGRQRTTMRSEQSFAEKLKQRQAQQRRQDAAREAETDAEFRARVLREMTDPVGHAAGARPECGAGEAPAAAARARRTTNRRPGRLRAGAARRHAARSYRAEDAPGGQGRLYQVPWLCLVYFGPATRGRRPSNCVLRTAADQDRKMWIGSRPN